MTRAPARNVLGALVAVLALALGGAACSSKPEPTPTAAATTPAPSPTPEPTPEPPPPPPPPTWPLTGAPGPVEARPALSVKIENTRDARPQTGLAQADLVFEELVEGGLTRFDAVFHSSLPEVVGPVRSARPTDAALSGPIGGLFAFSGGQPQFVGQIASTGLVMLSQDGGSAGFYREKSRKAPHNLYARVGDLYAQAGAAQAPPAQFAHAADAAGASAVGGSPAGQIDLAFPSSRPSWSWSGTAYERAESGAAAVTADGTRLSADNVVILRVQTQDTGAKDPAGAPVPETVLTGSGEATVATGGAAVTGTWSKAGPNDPFVLTLPDGAPLLLAPGRTWVELLPVSGSVTIA